MPAFEALTVTMIGGQGAAEVDLPRFRDCRVIGDPHAKDEVENLSRGTVGADVSSHPRPPTCRDPVWVQTFIHDYECVTLLNGRKAMVVAGVTPNP
ncbi:hypothetical protein BJ986_002255 [Phycicoccus badiiscoriae]|uniref:Uncharacterized protein n=1 Tax=Pedococcus badiiscoriae TaxID=642776 RepID=A0A852WFK7_9MICO|nr:hypothetical protein [Pedococcus badiiscoriae]